MISAIPKGRCGVSPLERMMEDALAAQIREMLFPNLVRKLLTKLSLNPPIEYSALSLKFVKNEPIRR